MTEHYLRVGLIGAGRMGADHARRIHERISNARLVAIGDSDSDRARQAADGIDGCRLHTDPLEVVEADDVDAVVLATPGPVHEPVLLACLRRGIPVLCEKPLTSDSESSWRVVEAEVATGRRLIQVGFMRRFDREYLELKNLLHTRAYGAPLLMHCAHRNPHAPPGFHDAMLINDSVVHEIDTTRWLLDDEIVAVTVRRAPTTVNAPEGLADPQLVTMETTSGVLVDVEIFVNCTFGYQVRCEAVCETGTALVGASAGMISNTGGRWGGSITPDFSARFGAAFDLEFQRWTYAALRGEVDGASAWDGYAAAAVAEAGVAAQHSGTRTEVKVGSRPSLYS